MDCRGALDIWNLIFRKIKTITHTYTNPPTTPLYSHVNLFYLYLSVFSSFFLLPALPSCFLFPIFLFTLLLLPALPSCFLVPAFPFHPSSCFPRFHPVSWFLLFFFTLLPASCFYSIPCFLLFPFILLPVSWFMLFLSSFFCFLLQS